MAGKASRVGRRMARLGRYGESTLARPRLDGNAWNGLAGQVG